MSEQSSPINLVMDKKLNTIRITNLINENV